MKSVKKILYIIPNLGMGGAERVSIEFTNQLKKEYQIELLLFEDLISVNRPNVKINIVKKIKFIPAFITGLWWVYKIKPNIIIAGLELSPVYLAMISKIIFGIKYISYIHVSLNERYERLNKYKHFHILFNYLSIKNSSLIVTVSEDLKENLEKRFKRKVYRIYNPIGIDCQKIILSEKKNIFYCVGRLSYQKGFDLVIKAASLLKKRKLIFKIEIYGDGELRLELTRMIAELGLSENVVLKGYIADRSQIFNPNKIFIFSSRYEGFGMALAEAGISGSPLISSDCNYGPREILSMVNYGYIFKNGDYEMLAEKMIYAIKYPQERDIHSIVKLKNEFSIKNFKKQWNDLIKKL